MAPSDPLRDLRVREYRAATDLGHRQIGSEHLLLALVDTESASAQAFRACGLSREAVLDEISRLPDGYHERMRSGGIPSGPSLAVDQDVRAIDGRAEGLAAGLGSTEVRDEHMLLSLSYEPTSILATRLIEKQGVTGEQILEELRRRGIKVPEVPPPTHPKWGTPFYVSREEFERLTADLRRRGVLYKFNYKEGDRVIISIDERGEEP
jgi:ATP-dependent Clp protease ATP-binding subunit ClpA